MIGYYKTLQEFVNVVPIGLDFVCYPPKSMRRLSFSQMFDNNSLNKKKILETYSLSDFEHCLIKKDTIYVFLCLNSEKELGIVHNSSAFVDVRFEIRAKIFS